MIGEFPRPGERPVGGPQVATYRLVSKLVERGLDLLVVSPHSSTTEVENKEDGLELVRVAAGGRGTLARGFQPWRRNVAAVLDREHVDVVHGQGLLPGGIAAVEAKARPTIITARGNVRADTEAEYSGLGGLARAYVRDFLAKRAVASADVVVGVNPEWKINVPRRPNRFVYIPNMIDEEFFDQPSDPEPGVMVFAGGGGRAIKGWPLLADAWPSVVEQAPEARLNMIGWPPDSSGIAHLQAPYRETVHTEPWLSSAELAARLARAAAVVIPSQFEVSPIVLAEAWAAGVPVVATRVGGIPPLATGAALLVDREVHALAEGMLTALTRPDETAELVAEGRRRAEAHRPEAVVSAHVELYEELTS